MTTIELVVSELIRQGVNENEANSDEVSVEIQIKKANQNRLFFGLGVASDKIIEFFNNTSASWNKQGSNVKGNRLKQPLARSYAIGWMYDFLSDGIISNQTTVKKDVPNTNNTLYWAQKSQLVEVYNQIFRDQLNIIHAQLVEIVAVGVVSGATLTFDELQLLSSGDMVSIGGVEYLIDTEASDGFIYELSTSPVAGTHYITYNYNFSPVIGVYPMLRLQNIKPYIS